MHPGSALSRSHPGLLAVVVLSTGCILGCIRDYPRLDGVPATATAPHVFFVSPPGEASRTTAAPSTTAAPDSTRPALTAPLRSPQTRLGLAEAIDLALRNHPQTSAAWADARAAAAGWAAARGAYWPTLDLDLSITHFKTAATGGRIAFSGTALGPSLSLSYLLLDLGGRGGTIENARQILLAADFTHNAVLQDVILQAELAYFRCLALRALLSAQETTLREAETNLEAAEHRHRVGLATIADVLQARTALSQSRLNVETTAGDLRTARGSLATALGLSANTAVQVAEPPGQVAVARVSRSVDQLIEQAVRLRPDLAAARAQVRAAEAQVRAVRGQGLPSLSLTGTAAWTYLIEDQSNYPTYSAGLTIRVPLFTGFTQTYQLLMAREQVKAAAERHRALEQEAIYQVFAAYQRLTTAAQKVATSDDLLASATASEQVALGRYREGVGSILDLLTAQTALAGARGQRVQAYWDWYTALAQLAHDCGVAGLGGERDLAGEHALAGQHPVGGEHTHGGERPIAHEEK